jgi:hypothetical protein
MTQSVIALTRRKSMRIRFEKAVAVCVITTTFLICFFGIRAEIRTAERSPPAHAAIQDEVFLQQ